MLTTSTSVALGFAFVLLGGINVWLALEAWSQLKAAKSSSRMLALHRIGGYLFIALFCLMSYYMLSRLRTEGADTSPTVTLHLGLAMLLSPLLFIKVLIARYYKNQHGLLMPIGLTIFVLAFVLIASTTGPYLARASKIERVSMDPEHLPAVAVDLNRASELMQRRCSKCHNLDRVLGARKDAQGWIATVARMQKVPGSGITDSDVRTIVSWLVSQNRPEGSGDAARLAVERALVDQRCGRCHSLDRVYKTVETPEKWREIVTRMVGYAAGSSGALQPGEDQKIIDYLSATQSPAAVSQRKARADAAATAGQSLIAQKAPVAVEKAPNPRFDGKAAGFFSLLGAGVVTLIVRRPGTRKQAGALQPSQSKTSALATPRSQNSPLILQLVQITQQTPDSRTLRFAVRGPRKLDAMPGQFLTFCFLFDGRKETRCYSICSSPARSGYVEITPKRMPNGCVSTFLNDQATIGMTVEATGPFGQFCLNATQDKKIALLAAGSGITPMMAILRYIEDYCLDTEVTLLYCVRAKQDIIFRQELDELPTRLKNFEYHLLLSRPEHDWLGARGHINREFVANHVADMNGRVFFVCGPPPFMDTARAILSDLGVAPDRIRVETFGSVASPKAGSPDASDGVFTVEFARSGKIAVVGQGQTLLEAAIENGVSIPSACRQGQCGTCKARLLEGQVHMTAEQGLDAESKSRGFILTCVGRPDGDVRLDV